MQLKKFITLITLASFLILGGCANLASELFEGSKQAAKDAVKESIDETKREVTDSVKNTTKENINKAKYGAVDEVKSAAKKAVENSKTIIWIDVRSEKEFDSEHLKVESPAELYNIPYDKIADEIKTVTTNHNDTIYLYCRSGYRAGIAAKALEKAGYKKVYNKGGLRDLVKQGYETTK